MDVLNLLERLDTYLQECSRLPLVGKIVVDEDEVFDLIDALQAAIPQEFERANWVLKEREQILQEARKEAQEIIRDAQSQIAARASEHLIAKEARLQAEQLIAQAKSVAEEINYGAREYADEMMKTVEDLLVELLERVRSDRNELGVREPQEKDDLEQETDNPGTEDEQFFADEMDDSMDDDEPARPRRFLWNQGRD
ncbi:MAG: ATPase [Bacillota bacterium]|jgi:cell division septum initiation protein DivIVA|nr:ATPase [Candidatus Fermentithermobacillaceae bacterium]